MKYFVASDIHGHFNQLIEALKDNYDENNPNHKLIVAGDLFDRGRQNVEVFEYVYRLHKEDKAIILKGNHELFFDELFELNIERIEFNIKHNGFGYTLNSFAPSYKTYKDVIEQINLNYPHLMPFLEQLPYYFETNNYIITHAGLDLSSGDWHNGNWKKAVWTNTELFFDIDLKEKYHINKKVIVGHRYAYLLRKKYLGNEDFSIYEHGDKQKVAIDGGVKYSNRINVYTFEDDSE